MQTANPVRATGSCLCGAVKYRVRGELRPVVYCHCEQCRRSSGHFVAATATRKENLIIDSDKALSWYHSSDVASRGFCNVCGASLFWSLKSDTCVSIMAGTIDQPSKLEAVEHIYVDFKADYYTLDDGLPRRPQGEQQTTLAGPDQVPAAGEIL